MSSIRDKRYGKAEFERYSEQMGYRDFEPDRDGNDGYRNPHTDAYWNFWVASRDAAALAQQAPKTCDGCGETAPSCACVEGAQQATGEPTVESLITEAAEAYSKGYPVNFTLVSQEVVRAVEGGSNE